MSNVYEWPTDGITAPCFVFGYPENITPKITFNRGGDEASFPLWYCVAAGQTSTKDVRDQLSVAIGQVNDVIATLDGEQSFGDVDVRDPKIEPVMSGGVNYMAVRYDCWVLTSGAMNMSAIMDGLAALLRAAGL